MENIINSIYESKLDPYQPFESLPMKIYLTCCVFLISFFSSFAQKGWRDNEMEVKLRIQGSSELKALYELYLQGDIYQASGYALFNKS